jgi:hypothetical protein
VHNTLKFVWFSAPLGIARALLAAAALAIVPLAAHADAPAGLDKYAGNYKYGNTRDHGVAIVEKALDQALADLNMVMKLLVKKTMSSRFAETVAIEIDGSDVGIKIGENDKATSKIGETKSVKSKDGKQSGQLSHQFDGSKLTETLSGENGTFVNVFTLSADGKTLTRDVTVTSQRMKKPLKYRLVYTRK